MLELTGDNEHSHWVALGILARTHMHRCMSSMYSRHTMPIEFVDQLIAMGNDVQRLLFHTCQHATFTTAYWTKVNPQMMKRLLDAIKISEEKCFGLGSARNDLRFLPEQPEHPSKMAIIRPKTAESRGYLAQISEFGNGNFGFFLVQPVATHPCRFGSHFCLCSCCSRRTPKMRCVFANATFTGGRATARSHENRSRGGVLSCRARWHMQGGMRVPYHARAPQQHEQRSRFGHWVWGHCHRAKGSNGSTRGSN